MFFFFSYFCESDDMRAKRDSTRIRTYGRRRTWVGTLWKSCLPILGWQDVDIRYVNVDIRYVNVDIRYVNVDNQGLFDLKFNWQASSGRAVNVNK